MSEFTYEVRDRVGYAVLNRPESRNALTFDMYNGLARVCREATVDGPARAIVVSGAGGKAFAAGTDIAQFRDFSEPQHALDYEAKIDRILTDIESCPVPTIAAITGACTGGGAAIAASCDIRLCDSRLRFGFPIARTLGNCLSIASLKRLTSLVGSGRIREILLTARLVEAEEALTMGLVSEVLEGPDDVLARATELAQTMAGHAPLTMMASKESLRRLRVDGPAAVADELIVQCFMSDDFREGMEAFLGKRKPSWQGK